MIGKHNYVYLSAALIEAGRKRREAERIRIAEKRHKYRKYANDKPGKPAEFVMWDGESPRDTGYSLFGNSKGMEICNPYLSTEQCLNLIYEAELEYPRAIHFGFGWDYDVSMMLHDLNKRQLTRLHATSYTLWEDWQIQHIPHKWFAVKRGKVTAKIYDVHSFFGSAYVPALQAFGIGTPEEIALLTSEKARRAEFLWAEIEEIREYMRLELKLGPDLMNALRESIHASGYRPKEWYGPGVLARMYINKKRDGVSVKDAMARCPDAVMLAARYAYIGGRFNQFLIGWMQTDVYEADLRSAYPHFLTKVPNLQRGTWREGREYEPGKFALYHIKYHARPKRDRQLYPLPKRMADYAVTWPHRVEGWYWSPEAELVANDEDAEFVEAWIFDEDDPTDRPFEFLKGYFQRRMRAKTNGHIEAYSLKIGMNATYGALAKRAGWQRVKGPPSTHQLEWAGYITSACRAAVYKAALACGDKLVSINTDSVQALCPLDDIVDVGDGLGQWELKHYSDGVMWQAGIYFLKDGDEWIKARTRGIPKGSYTPDDLIKAMASGDSLKLSKTQFIPYSLALMGQWDKRNQWVKTESTYDFGGGGYLQHDIVRCEKYCDGTRHRTFLNPFTHGPGTEQFSKPHYLPWIDDPDPVKVTFDDVLIADIRNMDIEDQWMLEYPIGG